MGFPTSVADEGDNSVDNCILLCFNCHAEVKSYNPKHPKGRFHMIKLQKVMILVHLLKTQEQI